MSCSLLRVLIVGWIALAVASPSFAQEPGGSGDEPATEDGAEKEDAEESDDEKAERDEKRKKSRKWGREKDEDGEELPTPTPAFLKRFTPAMEAYGEEDYAAAVVRLRKIPTKRLLPYEKAIMFRLLAYSLYAQEDLKGARKALQIAVAANGLEPDDQSDAMFTIARLYVVDSNWDKVIETLNQWFVMSETPNSSAYNLLALAYFQKGDYDNALEPANKSIELMTIPNEGWIRLVLALRLTRQDFAESVPLLEMLVKHFPKKTYWMQLSTVHGATGSYENALVPLQLAYAQGLLTEDTEVRRLAQLMMFLELPYRAAGALEGGIDESIVTSDVESWELLSNSWIAAREYERAVAPLEKAAALDPTGDLFIRLAQVHIQREKWKEATFALDKAITKGDLTKPCDALILMGIAHYSNKAPGTARGWFARAGGYGDCRDESSTWLQYIDRELAAIAADDAQKAQQAAEAQRATDDAAAPMREADSAPGDGAAL